MDILSLFVSANPRTDISTLNKVVLLDLTYKIYIHVLSISIHHVCETMIE